MEAKINVLINENKFEIEGSEEFVSKQIQNLKDLITESVERVENKPKTDLPVKKPNNGSQKSDNPIEQHPFIYVEDEDDLKLVCEIPGNSIAKKHFNTAILYAYGMTLKGEKKASYNKIGTICENHGFYDSAHFSEHIKSGDPQYYLDKGNRNSRTIKLNKPGKKKAKELIEMINKDAKQ